MSGWLVSWNAGKPKQAILDFVDGVTRRGPDFRPEAERVAVFDNDGTLWCEYPLLAQVYFLIDRVKMLCADRPALAERGAFRSMINGDWLALLAHGKCGVFELFAATHGGMSEEQFAVLASDWFAAARHRRRRPRICLRPELSVESIVRYARPGIGLWPDARQHAARLAAHFLTLPLSPLVHQALALRITQRKPT